MKFSIRKKIEIDESLYSFFHRSASANGGSLISFINMFRKNKYWFHKGDLHRFDFFPESAINLNRLIEMTGITESEIYKSSFSNVLFKLKGSSKEEGSMFLHKMIRDQLYYCPECLVEKKYLRINWKIVGINTCLKHHRKLFDNCHYCYKEILYKDIDNIGYCPYCKKDISKGFRVATADENINWNEQLWLYDSWASLLEINLDIKFQSKEIALRLLYILNNQLDIFNKKLVLEKRNASSITYFLQCARGTTKKRTVHIQTIISALFEHDLNMSDFFNMKIPDIFVLSIIKNKLKKLNPLRCNAPWCKSFGLEGRFYFTNSKNLISKGEQFTRYMICRDCGCEYGLNQNNMLIERTYFIKGYQILLNRSLFGLTWPEKEKILGLKRSRIRRILAYFYTRELFVEKKTIHNSVLHPELIMKFINAIMCNESIIDIQHWKCWKDDNEYLLYRYHPEIITTLIAQKERVNLKVGSVLVDDFYLKVETACDSLISINSDITLTSISKEIGCSATTIQNKGCAKVVSEYRNIQKNHRAVERKRVIIESSENYLNSRIGKYVYSKELYRNLIVCRDTIKALDPKLCDDIDKIKAHWNEKLRDSF